MAYSSNTTISVIIVGASLSGLMTGIAMAKSGFQVTILERFDAKPRSGAVLQVDTYESDTTETAKYLRKLASKGKKSVEAWSAVHLRLQNSAISTKNITLHYNTRIISADQNAESAWVKTSDNVIFKADLVVGADGYKSIIRKYVADEKPEAQYAGYMIWLAILDEKEIPLEHWPTADATTSMLNGIGDFLLGSVVEGMSGSKNIGERRLSWAWYDNTSNETLHQLGCVDDKNIAQHTLTSSQIPEDVLTDLQRKAIIRWPQPWLSVVLNCIKSKNIIGIPISEYTPYRMVNNRMVIIGDAAHVMSPITAMGFNAALEDASKIVEFVQKNIQSHSIPKALVDFEKHRLKAVQKLVRAGQSFSQSFGKNLSKKN